ncbi:MAG: peptidoglycan-binding protein [Microcoleaceae cyanobacterium]
MNLSVTRFSCLLLSQVLSQTVGLTLSLFPLVVQAQPLRGSTASQLAQSIPAAQLQRPTLQSGSTGPEVAELQAVLKLLEYYSGTVDGIYAEATAQAVAQFQRKMGLNPSGIMDQATWDRLLPPDNQPQAQTPDSQQAKNCDCSAQSDSVSSDTSARLPILQAGMKGEAVRALQERLQAAGFLQGQIDGVFGPETLEAVKTAQTQLQLNPDGIVGAETWIALFRV